MLPPDMRTDRVEILSIVPLVAAMPNMKVTPIRIMNRSSGQACMTFVAGMPAKIEPTIIAKATARIPTLISSLYMEIATTIRIAASEAKCRNSHS